jgi:hypothetical protein
VSAVNTLTTVAVVLVGSLSYLVHRVHQGLLACILHLPPSAVPLVSDVRFRRSGTALGAVDTVAYWPGSLSEILAEPTAGPGPSQADRHTFPVASAGCLHYPGGIVVGADCPLDASHKPGGKVPAVTECGDPS